MSTKRQRSPIASWPPRISWVDWTRKDRLATEREQDLASQQATVQSLQASLTEAERSVAQVRSRSRSDLQTQLVETSGRIAQLEQADVKLGFRGRNLELRAPQAGVVKDLATTTVGAVVQPGTVLLNLVPVGELLRAEVSIRNDDIGFVRAGQKVRLKLATFPFQRYGLLEGTVLSVSPDSASAGRSVRAGRGGCAGAAGVQGDHPVGLTDAERRDGSVRDGCGNAVDGGDRGRRADGHAVLDVAGPEGGQ